MKHKTASSPYYLAKALFLIALVVMVAIEFVDPPKALAVGNVPDNIKLLLADYSHYVETGSSTRKEDYSSQMNVLMAERAEYYKEFVTTQVSR